MCKKVSLSLNAWFSLFFHRVCKLFGIQYYYQSKYGIKVLNRKDESCTLLKISTSKVDPAKVLLFADGLKDEYTLTGKRILESPHFNLVKGIIENNYTLCRDYCEREKLGALDGRFALVFNRKTIEAHSLATFNNKVLIEKGLANNPSLCYFRGNYYALDGKHRLAMAAYLGKDIYCDIFSWEDILQTSYIKNMKRLMVKMPLEYSVNLNLLLAIKYDGTLE